MAATIDWTGASATPPYKARITIPQADMVLQSGTLYTYDTDAFWEELKAAEASEDGIVFPDLQQRAEAQTVAGTTFAPFLRSLAEIQMENTGTFYSVRLEGTNNDLWDEEGGVFIPHAFVGVIPTNSAGLVIAETGTSGLTPAESATLSGIETTVNEISLWSKIALFGKKILKRSPSPASGTPGTIEVYNPDTDLLAGTGDIYEDEDATIGYRGKGIDHQDKIT